jgi:hypothetical protein
MNDFAKAVKPCVLDKRKAQAFKSKAVLFSCPKKLLQKIYS